MVLNYFIKSRLKQTMFVGIQMLVYCSNHHYDKIFCNVHSFMENDSSWCSKLSKAADRNLTHPVLKDICMSNCSDIYISSGSTQVRFKETVSACT